MARIVQDSGPEDHYTMVPNEIARSSSIPPRAKVVYIFIRSHRDGWELTSDRIAKSLGMSPTTVKAALRDLEAHGYLTRKQVHGEGGVFANVEYTVHSAPATGVQNLSPATVVQKTAGGKTDSGKSDPHKKTIPSKKTNLEEDQPPCSPPQGDGGGGVIDLPLPEPPAVAAADEASAGPSTAGTGYPPAFEEWWADYPKKTGKKAALRAWRTAKKTRSATTLHARLIDHLPSLHATQQRNPRYVPNPATWLNQGRYDDPVEPTQQPITQQDQRRLALIQAAANYDNQNQEPHEQPELGSGRSPTDRLLPDPRCIPPEHGDHPGPRQHLG